jgi:hypothetical protein
MVIEDVAQNQVRIARLDATRVAVVKGLYDGIAGGQVIVIDGTTLEAVGRSGAIRKLGQLAGGPNGTEAGTVAVKPDLSQWLYTLTDDKWNSFIHLGGAGGDAVVATVPSPDGNAFYQPYAWNTSGVYMVKQATGLGGAGPFLEYHFNLARFDLASARLTDASPACLVFSVLDDGTIVCRPAYDSGRLEVRTPSGATHLIQVATGNGVGTDFEFRRVTVSPDGARLAAARNGAKSPILNYQIAVADLSATSTAAFGPLDYVPDTWLPDGRLVAHHECVYADWGAGPCNANLDGTYLFSADGSSRTLFYKLASSWVVGSI